MTDHITLPSAVVEQALDALDSDNPDIQLRAAIELRSAFIRAALAEPVQEPMKHDDIRRMARKAGIRLATLSDPIDSRNVYLHELERFVSVLEPEIEKLREDANRYLWLRQIDKPDLWSALLDRRVVCAWGALDSAINDSMLES